MAVSNYVYGSNTLKFDDVIGVIMSDEARRKIASGSTSESALNAQRIGKMIERGNNSRNHGKSRGKSKGGGLNQEDQMTAGTVGNQGTKRKIVGIEKKNEGDKLNGDKEANVVSNKFDEDSFLLSLESVDHSWVLDSHFTLWF